MNIYISGFMAAGKTTVGRKLARILGRRFVDLDAQIERRGRRSIPKLFEDGEKSFRRLESAALRLAARQNGQVVALGGGALLSAQNKRLARSSGILVSLTCAQPELWRRLKHGCRKRPLLARRPQTRWLLLFKKRRRLYLDADILVSTTRRTPHQAAMRIAALLRRIEPRLV